MFKRVIVEWKKKQFKLTMDEEETLDAFVACGGEPNGDGEVDVSRLVEIIKDQF